MLRPDFCIAGAGIIGLSLALELQRRGATVTVLERGAPLAQASTAAAGMLAAQDPDNPPALQPLSDLSIALYPEYLARIESLSQLPVPFQTSLTLQSISSSHPAFQHPTSLTPQHPFLPSLPQNSHLLSLDEHSLDPHQLAHSLFAAIQHLPIDLRTNSPARHIHSGQHSVTIETSSGTIHAGAFVDCTGAWAANLSTLPITPRKGQMLAVQLPSTLPLDFVLRTPEIYVVPRTQGHAAGRAIIGATVEDCGFDKTVQPQDIAQLHAAAARLLPQLAAASVLDSWAGLRPAVSDLLPLLGAHPSHPRSYLATGHYRNGILLAPATARVMAQLLFNENPSVELAPFSPNRTLPLQHIETPIAH